jgi:hypothetical protein
VGFRAAGGLEGTEETFGCGEKNVMDECVFFLD